jgi:hypothetical protein
MTQKIMTFDELCQEFATVVTAVAEGLLDTANDRQYFQGLLETVKDPQMKAYYHALRDRYAP